MAQWTKYDYTETSLRETVPRCRSYADVLRALDIPISGSYTRTISKRIKKYEIDVSHFWKPGERRRVNKPRRTTPEQRLVCLSVDSPRVKGATLRRDLLAIGRPYQCVGEDCPTVGPIWVGKLMTLQVDHKDGKSWNNEPSNLQFLCPNCHSQTENFAGRGNTKPLPPPSFCKCGRTKTAKSEVCRSCHQHKPSVRKIEWPSPRDMNDLLEANQHNYRAMGRILGVSDNAVRKHIKSMLS